MATAPFSAPQVLFCFYPNLTLIVLKSNTPGQRGSHSCRGGRCQPRGELSKRPTRFRKGDPARREAALGQEYSHLRDTP